MAKNNRNVGESSGCLVSGSPLGVMGLILQPKTNLLGCGDINGLTSTACFAMLNTDIIVKAKV